jgi:hypothetical protein
VTHAELIDDIEVGARLAGPARIARNIPTRPRLLAELRLAQPE